MKILFLGPPNSALVDFLSRSDSVVSFADRLELDWLKSLKADFLISYGYRFIIKPDVLELFPNRAINLHISLLPWNRGSDPNPWSFLENTPKGVTIHHLDPGVDTGDIIVQKELFFEEKETLRSSYHTLHSEIRRLFIENWPSLKTGKCDRKKQQGKGTSHRIRDRGVFEALLADRGWDTPVHQLTAAGKRLGLCFSLQ